MCKYQLHRLYKHFIQTIFGINNLKIIFTNRRITLKLLIDFDELSITCNICHRQNELNHYY